MESEDAEVMEDQISQEKMLTEDKDFGQFSIKMSLRIIIQLGSLLPMHHCSVTLKVNKTVFMIKVKIKTMLTLGYQENSIQKCLVKS